MRRPPSERQVERASLAKAQVHARKKATAARERRLERTKDAVKTWRLAKSRAKELTQGARSDEKAVSVAKEAVRDFERQEVRRHSRLLHRCYRCYCSTRRGSYPCDGKISSYVYEDARIEEALAQESRKLAVQARNFQREAREAATSGSSEALRRLQRVEARFYKLEDAYYKRVRELDLERESLRSLYGVKEVHGYWRAEAPETLCPSVSTRVIAKRLNDWQQGKQRATGARMVLHATVQEEQAGS